ncbi:cell division cycle- protein [Spiromyces aspiralis]|uniref:Cell division cycle- protein n=1 Tax=Spiromyces aspiralis TaxID=68401 RepID=A0ACC1HZ19_9FUNG|nr:cell division cycle- protein [Spiromyces aspiralis]
MQSCRSTIKAKAFYDTEAAAAHPPWLRSAMISDSEDDLSDAGSHMAPGNARLPELPGSHPPSEGALATVAMRRSSSLPAVQTQLHPPSTHAYHARDPHSRSNITSRLHGKLSSFLSRRPSDSDYESPDDALATVESRPTVVAPVPAYHGGALNSAPLCTRSNHALRPTTGLSSQSESRASNESSQQQSRIIYRPPLVINPDEHDRLLLLMGGNNTVTAPASAKYQTPSQNPGPQFVNAVQAAVVCATKEGCKPYPYPPKDRTVVAQSRGDSQHGSPTHPTSYLTKGAERTAVSLAQSSLYISKSSAETIVAVIEDTGSIAAAASGTLSVCGSPVNMRLNRSDTAETLLTTTTVSLSDADGDSDNNNNNNISEGSNSQVARALGEAGEEVKVEGEVVVVGENKRYQRCGSASMLHPSVNSPKLSTKPCLKLSISKDANRKEPMAERPLGGDESIENKGTLAIRRTSTTTLLRLSDYLVPDNNNNSSCITDDGSDGEELLLNMSKSLSEGCYGTNVSAPSGIVSSITTRAAPNDITITTTATDVGSSAMAMAPASASQATCFDTKSTRASSTSSCATPTMSQSQRMSLLFQKGPHGGVRRLGPFMASETRGGRLIAHLTPHLVELLNIQAADEFTATALKEVAERQRRRRRLSQPLSPAHQDDPNASDYEGCLSDDCQPPSSNTNGSEGVATPWPLDSDDVSSELAYYDQSVSGPSKNEGQCGNLATVATVSTATAVSDSLEEKSPIVDMSFSSTSQSSQSPNLDSAHKQQRNYHRLSFKSVDKARLASGIPSNISAVSLSQFVLSNEPAVAAPNPSSADALPRRASTLKDSFELKSDIMSPRPGGLKSVSLRVMVYWLAQSSGDADSEYINVFLSSYRFFAHPVDLLRLLIVRYINCYSTTTTTTTTTSKTGDLDADQFGLTTSDRESTIVQLRVLNILKQWIRHHPQDFRLHSRLTRLLLSFLTFIRHQPGRGPFASQLANKLQSLELLSPAESNQQICSVVADNNITSTSNPPVTAVSASEHVVSAAQQVKSPSAITRVTTAPFPHHRRQDSLQSIMTISSVVKPQYQSRAAANTSPTDLLTAIKRVKSANNVAAITSLAHLHGANLNKPLPPRPRPPKKSSSTFFLSSILGKSKRSTESLKSPSKSPGLPLSREHFRSVNGSTVSLAPSLSVPSANSGVSRPLNLRIEVSGKNSLTDLASDALNMPSPMEQFSPPMTALDSTLWELSRTFSDSIDILHLDPLAVAQQFALIEHAMFCKISATEFSLKSRCTALSSSHQQQLQLHQRRPSSATDQSTASAETSDDYAEGLDDDNPIANLMEFTRWFNHVTYWVTLTVLAQPTSQKRAATITRFVHISYHCLALRNYATSLEISTALKSSAIRRLRSAWTLVPALVQDVLHSITMFWEEKPNFQLYRESIKAALSGKSGPDSTVFAPPEGYFRNILPDSGGSLGAGSRLGNAVSTSGDNKVGMTTTALPTPAIGSSNVNVSGTGGSSSRAAGARFSMLPLPRSAGPTVTKFDMSSDHRRAATGKLGGLWTSTASAGRVSSTYKSYVEASTSDYKYIEQAWAIRNMNDSTAVSPAQQLLVPGTASEPSSQPSTPLSGVPLLSRPQQPYPVVPFIGLYITGLLHADVGNPAYTSPKPSSLGGSAAQSPPLINLHKFRVIAAMLRGLSLAQLTPYPYKPDTVLQSWINQQVKNVPQNIAHALKAISEASYNNSLTNSASSGEIQTPISRQFDAAVLSSSIATLTASTAITTCATKNGKASSCTLSKQEPNQQFEDELFAISRLIEPAGSNAAASSQAS